MMMIIMIMVHLFNQSIKTLYFAAFNDFLRCLNKVKYTQNEEMN